MTTLFFAHSAFGRHEVPSGHVERPARYEAVERALRREEFSGLERREPPLAGADEIERVHSQRYRRFVEASAPHSGLASFDPDTFMGPSSLEAALRAAGGAVAATQAVMAKEAKNAFVAARPPGHHAEPGRAMGFCIFNSAAIAAMQARAQGAERVAVVDFDVHHGNGVQAAFWNDENAFYASSHEWPQYPGTGRESEKGAFDNIRNAHLRRGAGGKEFARVWGDLLLPALSDFGPEFIVICAGFDAHEADPLGGLLLVEDDFAWITAEIAAIAKDKAGGRLISLLEGGYDLPALERCVAAHVKSLMAA
jgi:acetoin utilization deacetylase AcuC-like enzyme